MTEATELLSGSDTFGAARPQRARRYLLLDVFAEQPLEGNQLAVFTDAQGLGGKTMQSVARELKLSETIFTLAPHEAGDARVRIFTPEAELAFAGHPVLGVATIAARALGRTNVVIETRSGKVGVSVEIEDTLAASARMRRPTPVGAPFERQRELLRALGLQCSTMPIYAYSNGPLHVLVGLESPEQVAQLKPDSSALSALGEVCVSCFAGAGGRWKTRMFAPGLGVAEDPATGSAAGPLAAHLARHERIDYGMEIEIDQGAEIGRPSRLLAMVDGPSERAGAVEVGGRVLLVGRGELLLP
jgi:trans-2,3-dihydro-3-hydroxyanthranilate isomerase